MGIMHLFKAKSRKLMLAKLLENRNYKILCSRKCNVYKSRKFLNLMFTKIYFKGGGKFIPPPVEALFPGRGAEIWFQLGSWG